MVRGVQHDFHRYQSHRFARPRPIRMRLVLDKSRRPIRGSSGFLVLALFLRTDDLRSALILETADDTFFLFVMYNKIIWWMYVCMCEGVSVSV